MNCDRRRDPRPARGNDASSERGVSAVLIAVCASMLIAFAAFVLDTGALYTERRELQVGADAGALALAQDCAKSNCTNLSAKADVMADLNASDGQSTATAQLLGASSVEVVNRTNDAGSNIDGDASTVDFHFARIFGQNGHAVSARAVASWYYPGGATTLPLTFSLCEWNATGGLNGLTPGPPYSGPVDVIFFHDPTVSKGAGVCPSGPAGQDIPGGFGWLSPTTGCSVTINAAGWVAGSTGNSAPNGCNDPASLINREVLLPIFDDVKKSPQSVGLCGANRCYHIYGFAGFYITGMQLGGNGNAWTINAPPGCSPSKRCIGGYFVRFVQGATAGTGVGGPNLGAAVVKLVE